MKFTPFGAAWDQGWARPAPKYVQGRAYAYADLYGHTVCGPERIMTEGDYAWERKVKRSHKDGGRLLSVVDQESVDRAQAEYERTRKERADRDRASRLAREQEYLEAQKATEKARQRRLAQMEMGKQQALRAAELHQLANEIRLSEIDHDPAKFERWLIRKGIITEAESVTGIKDGVVTTTKGAPE